MSEQKQKTCLLVEGINDMAVVRAICGKSKFKTLDKIIDCKGIENFPKHVKANRKENMWEILGLIADADNSAESRFTSLSHHLTKENGYSNLPQEIPPNGLIHKDRNPSLPKLGIWIMPNNQSCGYLEDFLMSLIPQDDLEMLHAKKSVKSLEKPKFSKTHESKALLSTWLSWQEDPAIRYGQAISANFIRLNHSDAKNFQKWLKDLFEI